MKHTHCTTCGRPINGTGMNNGNNARCVACRVAASLRGWEYRPNPYNVLLYVQDEAAWAARPERISWERLLKMEAGE